MYSLARLFIGLYLGMASLAWGTSEFRGTVCADRLYLDSIGKVLGGVSSKDSAFMRIQQHLASLPQTSPETVRLPFQFSNDLSVHFHQIAHPHETIAVYAVYIPRMNVNTGGIVNSSVTDVGEYYFAVAFKTPEQKSVLKHLLGHHQMWEPIKRLSIEGWQGEVVLMHPETFFIFSSRFKEFMPRSVVADPPVPTHVEIPPQPVSPDIFQQLIARLTTLRSPSDVEQSLSTLQKIATGTKLHPHFVMQSLSSVAHAYLKQMKEHMDDFSSDGTQQDAIKQIADGSSLAAGPANSNPTFRFLFLSGLDLDNTSFQMGGYLFLGGRLSHEQLLRVLYREWARELFMPDLEGNLPSNHISGGVLQAEYDDQGRLHTLTLVDDSIELSRPDSVSQEIRMLMWQRATLRDHIKYLKTYDYIPSDTVISIP